MRKSLGLALPLLLCGCFSGGAESAFPLYRHEGEPTLPADQLAKLAGPIESVDGLRVIKYGSSFTLLPGCHEVVNQRTWGGSDGMSVSIAHLPGLVFAVPMRKGYSYVLEITGGAGRVMIGMSERDPNGEVTQRFQPGQPCVAAAG